MVKEAKIALLSVFGIRNCPMEDYGCDIRSFARLIRASLEVINLRGYPFTLTAFFSTTAIEDYM